jgi:hypothetical protein
MRASTNLDRQPPALPGVQPMRRTIHYHCDSMTPGRAGGCQPPRVQNGLTGFVPINRAGIAAAFIALAAFLVTTCTVSAADNDKKIAIQVELVEVAAPVQPVPAAAPAAAPAAPAAAAPPPAPVAAAIEVIGPVAAPAAEPAKKEKSVVKRNAKQTQLARPKKLGVPLWYPTIYPNPLAFNMAWTNISDKTFADVRALANRQKVVVRRVAIRRQALRQPQQNQNAQNAMQQQMRRFLEPILKTELSFAIRAAELNDTERIKLITDGKTWFEGFLADYLKKLDPNQQQMILQGMQGVWFGNQQQRAESPREAIQAGIAKLIKEKLPAKKVTAYEKECKLRAEFARHTAIDNSVERIDEKVRLSPDQWKKITQALNDHLDKNREPQLESFALNYQTMVSGAPDQWVLPELTPAQQAVLRRVNQYSGQMFIGGGIFGQMFGGDNSVIDDVDLDNPKPAAADHAAQPAPLHSEAE